MEKKELVYDDEKAVDFILNDLKKKKILMKKEDAEYLMDILYDFYEDSGVLLDEDEEPSEEKNEIYVDHEQMIQFILDTLEEEENTHLFRKDDIEAFLEAEMAYCESIGIITGEEED